MILLISSRRRSALMSSPQRSSSLQTGDFPHICPVRDDPPHFKQDTFRIVVKSAMVLLISNRRHSALLTSPRWSLSFQTGDIPQGCQLREDPPHLKQETFRIVVKSAMILLISNRRRSALLSSPRWSSSFTTRGFSDCCQVRDDPHFKQETFRIVVMCAIILLISSRSRSALLSCPR